METSSTRRKRILERGSDRLALITGRIDSLPSSSEPHHLHTVSSPAALIYQDRDSLPNLFNQSNTTSKHEVDVPHTELPRCQTSDGSIRSASTGTAEGLEPQLRKCETHVDTTRTPTLDIGRKVQPPLVPSKVRGPSSSAVNEPGPHREASSHYTQILLCKIGSSVTASENIRIVSTITIALLVILSHLRLPLVSSRILATIIATRPVYLVLLTDITILFARAISDKPEEYAKLSHSEDASWANGYLTALGFGLALYKAITAVLMDCSVYFVVVISGLSLLRGFL